MGLPVGRGRVPTERELVMESIHRIFGSLGVMLFVGVACLPATGCAFEAASIDDPDEGAAESVGDTAMSFEAFKAESPWDPQIGAYIVEGDIPLRTEEALARYYEEHVQQGALIVNRVGAADDRWSDAQKRDLTYCVSKALAKTTIRSSRRCATRPRPGSRLRTCITRT